MKELSLEEKARRYDEAIKVAKGNYETIVQMDKDCTFSREGIINIFHHMFPELKEDGDEKIRKEILSFLKEGKPYHCPNSVKRQEWAAWLEKQGEQKPTEWHKEDEQNLNVCLGYIPDEYLRRWLKDVIHIKYDKPADKVEPKFHEGDWIACEELNTAKIINIVDDKYEVEFIDGNKGFPHIDYIDRNFYLWTIQDAKDGDVLHSTGWHSDCIFIFNGLDNWKFDELNGDRAVATGYCCLSVSADNMEFGIQGPDCVEVNTIKPATKIQRNLLFQKMNEDGYEWDADKKELKKIEQKPADRSERKFEIGDLITNGVLVGKIDEIYEYCGEFNYHAYFGYYYSDVSDAENWHKWTINDAKDGDVLAGHECYVIFKEIDGMNIKCYCTYHYMGFHPSFYADTLQNKTSFYPATKEQRDLLFKRMQEAGYEWDVDKKELKKIEQKPTDTPKFKVGDKIRKKTPSSFDRDMQVARIEKDYYICNHIGKFSSEVVPFSEESSYDLIEQKTDWGEEDKRNIDRIYSILRQAADTHAFSTSCRLIGDKECIELQDFLKSLKDRHTWLPSDEQIEALIWQVNNTYKGSWQYKATKELLEQLKKIKGE